MLQIIQAAGKQFPAVLHVRNREPAARIIIGWRQMNDQLSIADHKLLISIHIFLLS